MPADLLGEVESQRLPGAGDRGDRLGLHRTAGIRGVLDLEPYADARGGRVDPHRHARVSLR